MQTACIFSPQNAQDVSSALRTLGRIHEQGETCPFAIRSDGHTAWAVAFNIQGGAVVDMGLLNEFELSANKKTVSVVVAATWGDVYQGLRPLGLSVNGGRVSTPGEFRVDFPKKACALRRIKRC